MFYCCCCCSGCYASFGTQRQTANTKNKRKEIDYFYLIGLHCCHFLEHTLHYSLRLSVSCKICTQPFLPLKLLHLIKQCQEWNVLHIHTHTAAATTRTTTMENLPSHHICSIRKKFARFFDKWECRSRDFSTTYKTKQNKIPPATHIRTDNNEQKSSNVHF